MSVDRDTLAATFDAAEAIASGAARGLGGPWRWVAWVVAGASRIGAQLAREGYSPEEIAERIGRVEPHRADAVDERVDSVVQRMPARDEEGTDPGKPGAR